MAVADEKTPAQAVENEEAQLDMSQQQFVGEWQDVGSEETMTWKTWIVIFILSSCFGLSFW